MNCPVCDAPLRTIEKYGVDVDICTGCKGVWLDRGELEKILELEAAGGPTLRQEAERTRTPRDDYRRDDDDRARDAHGRHGQRKRRESWLGELLGGFGDD